MAAVEQADDPIEIEVGSFGLPADAGVVPLETLDRPQVPRALLVSTALIALVGGVLIGRSTASESATGAEDTASASATTVAAAAVLPLVSIPPVDSEPPALTPRPTATTLARGELNVTTRQLAIDERVVGTDLRLVGLGDGELYDLDLTTGTVTVTAHTELAARSGARLEHRSLHAGDDWMLVSNAWQSGFIVYREGERDVERLVRHPLVHVPGTERFWAQDQEQQWSVEIDLDGQPTGAEVDVDVFDIVPDPLGGVLFERGGRWYSLVDDTLVAFPNGEIRSVSAEYALLTSCDDQMVCGLQLYDRSTETSREVPIDAAIDPMEPETYRYHFGTSRPSVAPGGGHAVVVQTRPGTWSLDLIDLVTGERWRLPASDVWSTSLVWSPDGRLLFLTSGGRVNVFDTRTGEPFPLLTESFSRWFRLTARPASTPGS